jgi:hypothetical protein
MKEMSVFCVSSCARWFIALTGLARGTHSLRRDRLGAGAQPPDESAGQHQSDRDQLSCPSLRRQRRSHGRFKGSAYLGINPVFR